jgi:uncharacterized protein YwgA
MKKPISHIFNLIGVRDFNTLESRIKFQKTIYLLKEMGAIKEKFNFSWYMFGPYCSDVAKIGFEFIDNKIDKELNVSDDFENKLNNFLKIMKSCDGNESKWLELLATTHMIRKQNNMNKEEVFQKIIKHQYYFNNKDLFEKCWKILDFNFVF